MSRIGAAARRGATVKRTSAPRVRPAPLPAVEKRRRERDRIARALAPVLGVDPNDPRAVLEAAKAHLDRRREQKRAVVNAWAEVDRREREQHLERRFGVLARLRDGSIALCRRADRLPPGAVPIPAQQARAAIESAPRRVVVGVMGTASPPASKATFAVLVRPLLEAA